MPKLVHSRESIQTQTIIGRKIGDKPYSHEYINNRVSLEVSLILTKGTEILKLNGMSRTFTNCELETSFMGSQNLRRIIEVDLDLETNEAEPDEELYNRIQEQRKRVIDALRYGLPFSHQGQRYNFQLKK
jgi:hypothetical protein